MPNYCWNRLTVIGPEETVALFVEKARGPIQKWPRQRWESEEEDYNKPTPVEAFCFHALDPIPDEVLASDYSSVGWDFEHQHWGVRWGASESKLVVRSPGKAIYTFTTPWGPGITLHRKVAAKWPTLTFALSWGEEYPSRGRILWRGETEIMVAQNNEPPRHAGDRWRDELLASHDAWVFGLHAEDD